MKQLPHAVALGAILALTFPSVSAQSSSSIPTRSEERQQILDDTKVIYTGTERPAQDSVQSLLRQFYMDQFRQFHDPDAPTFMLMSSDAKVALGIGGKAMLRGWADWNGSQDSYEFFPYDISIPKNPTESRLLDASPSQSSVFLTLLGKTDKSHYMVYIQAGVKNKDFVLKKAYVSYNDFTLGLAGTTFADDDALVPTVDAQGPNGQVGKSQFLARYFHTFKNGVSVGAGVEVPSSSQSEIAGETAACRDFVPDVAALVQYGWGDSHVRASGILRTMSYRNLLSSSNHNVVGWGAQLSGVIDIIRPLTLYFTGVVGKGVGSYQGDLSEGEYDLVGTSDRPGKMVAPWSMGLTAGVQYKFSRKVYACIALGEQRYYLKHRLNDDQYKYGLYGAANLFWKITPRFLTGIEYITGKRMNFDGSYAGANRIDAMLSYSF